MGYVENRAGTLVIRILLTLHDGLWLALCAFVLMLGFAAAPAYAYVDPSIMTYTIQAVAGVAVALSTVVGVLARRSRKKLMKLLDIDENAKRQVEPPVHRAGAAATAAADATATVAGAAGEGVAAASGAVAASKAAGESAAATVSVARAAAPDASGADGARTNPQPKRKRGRKPKRTYAPPWRTRIVYALLACGFTICTIFVVAPYEVIGGSAGSLVFSLVDVWWVAALPAVAAIAATSLLLSALRGRVFNFVLVLVTCIGVAAYVQALVLNYGMPAADGSTIVWAEHRNMMIVSGAVWAVIILVPLALSFLNRFRAQGVVGLVCACLLVVQGVGVASLFVAPPAPAEQTGGMDDLAHTNVISQTETAMTEEGLFTVSSKSNVIVFVLDTFDQTLLNTLVRQNIDLLDEFDGFTEFMNCTGSMIPTRFAVPYLLTGQLPAANETSESYLENRYARGHFLSDANAAGYSVGLYTDSLQIGSLPQEQQQTIAGQTMNMRKVSSSSVDFAGTLQAMVQIALYRDVPWSFKQNFWYYTDQINGRIVSYNPNASASERVYTMNDPRYFTQLKSQGLEASDTAQAGAFRFIHLLGAHYPYSIDEQANDLGTDNSTKEKQAQGALCIVKEYMRQLKELGVYDQSTIIVTADHGRWFLTAEPLTTTSTPIMLVKPAVGDGTAASAADSSRGESNEVQVSTMPVSHHDYLPTVAAAMGLNPANYGSGQTLFQVNDPNRVRTYLTTDSVGLRGVGWREYVVVGNDLLLSNWSESGNYWSLQE